MHYRYFLEPASPLKSLQTSQQLIKSSAAAYSTDNLAELKAITLTPPSSLRLYKPNSTHHQQHQQSLHITNGYEQKFTPDDNDLFAPAHQLKNESKVDYENKNVANATNMKNQNALSSSRNVSENQNYFTPESDFIADFSKANIFDVPNSSEVSTLKNGLSNKRDYNNSIQSTSNLTNGTGSGNGENFADFEHNTIYNAAGKSCHNFFNSMR